MAMRQQKEALELSMLASLKSRSWSMDRLEK